VPRARRIFGGMTHQHTSRAARREFLSAMGLGIAAAAFPSASLLPRLSHAQSSAQLITKAIPKTGERVPAIGLGTFLTFDLLPGQNRDHLREVMRRFWEGGGRVVDTSPLYGTGETNVGDCATALSIGQELFIANKIWATGEYLNDDSHAQRSLEQSLNRLWRERIELMQVHSLVNVHFVVELLQAWKNEGKIRYLGVTHYEPAYMTELASWVESGTIDFVQTNYSMASREAEVRLLPAAADRGVAVLTNMPFEKSRLFKITAGRSLPAFAKELGIESWAQYFLKWVVSHPAVTCALPATSNPDHVTSNMGAMRGPLPDAPMRTRMLRHMETLPGFQEVARMPWYPDKSYAGEISRAQRKVRSRQ
jgi:diketogulonate reductase-like aldo/keto reductase